MLESLDRLWAELVELLNGRIACSDFWYGNELTFLRKFGQISDHFELFCGKSDNPKIVVFGRNELFKALAGFKFVGRLIKIEKSFDVFENVILLGGKVRHAQMGKFK